MTDIADTAPDGRRFHTAASGGSIMQLATAIRGDEFDTDRGAPASLVYETPVGSSLVRTGTIKRRNAAGARTATMAIAVDGGYRCIDAFGHVSTDRGRQLGELRDVRLCRNDG